LHGCKIVVVLEARRQLREEATVRWGQIAQSHAQTFAFGPEAPRQQHLFQSIAVRRRAAETEDLHLVIAATAPEVVCESVDDTRQAIGINADREVKVAGSESSSGTSLLVHDGDEMSAIQDEVTSREAIPVQRRNRVAVDVHAGRIQAADAEHVPGLGCAGGSQLRIGDRVLLSGKVSDEVPLRGISCRHQIFAYLPDARWPEPLSLASLLCEPSSQIGREHRHWRNAEGLQPLGDTPPLGFYRI